jgi:hypothetical protein
MFVVLLRYEFSHIVWSMSVEQSGNDNAVDSSGSAVVVVLDIVVVGIEHFRIVNVSTDLSTKYLGHVPPKLLIVFNYS